MGDRLIYYKDCPKCGKENGIEVYDHPSALMYVAICENCGYKEDLDYYELDENTIVLCSKKEYEKIKKEHEKSKKNKQKKKKIREVKEMEKITKALVGKRVLFTKWLWQSEDYPSEGIIKELSPSGKYVRIAYRKDDLGNWYKTEYIRIIEVLGEAIDEEENEEDL